MQDIWEPELYRNNSQMQKRWATVALNEINIDNILNPYVLDVGSGAGNITFEIARKYRRGRIFGLDLSEKMVKYADTQYKAPNLFFFVGDAQKLIFEEQFDLVVSFSTLHRVADPALAIKNIFASLKPEGLFAAVFPVREQPLISQAIAQVDSKFSWERPLSTLDRKTYDLSDIQCREWLKNAGFSVIKAHTKWENEIFDSREKFRDTLRATSSYRILLPPDKEIKFFDDVVDAYLEKAPLDDQGRVHFFFNRVEILAIKPMIEMKH